MKRGVLNGLTVLSLLLCIATGALWSRSDDYGDTIVVGFRNRFHLTVASYRGRWLTITAVSNPERIRHEFSETGWMPFPYEWQWHARRPSAETRVRFMRGAVKVAIRGDRGGFGGWSAPMPAFELATPTWPVVLTTVILPAVWLARRAGAEARAVGRWRRFRRGHCVSCGYDLRGSADRCPECGVPHDDVMPPVSWRLASAFGERAILLSRWAAITAALGICLRLFDDGSYDFPAAARTVERALAMAGVLCGVTGGARAAGTARATGVLGGLVNVGLLGMTFLPRIYR
jgi:hypothetical protein